MQKQTILTAVVGLSLCGLFANSASALQQVATSLDLTLKASKWSGAYYYSEAMVTGINETQISETDNPDIIGGDAVKEKFSNKTILNGSKGKLVFVWAGPGASSAYPYLASFIAGKGKDFPPIIDPIGGWQKPRCLFIEEPENPKSTVNGTIRVVESGAPGGTEVIVPDTRDPKSVPKEEQKATGYTQFRFGLPGATPADADAIRGWGPFTTDFKKLFYTGGKVRLTGSSVVAE